MKVLVGACVSVGKAVKSEGFVGVIGVCVDSGSVGVVTFSTALGEQEIKKLASKTSVEKVLKVFIFS